MAVVTYEMLEGHEAESRLDTFLPVYKEVFAEPPYCDGPEEVDEFICVFHIQAQRPDSTPASSTGSPWSGRP